MKRSRISQLLQISIYIIAIGLTLQLLLPTSESEDGIHLIVEADDSEPGVTVTFETFPDGTPIVEDTHLVGNEYSSQGVLFAGAPLDAYCADAETAIMAPPHSTGLPWINFLSTAGPDDFDCNSVPIEIMFVDPVQYIRLSFNGATVQYVMQVYDESGTLLGEETQWGQCCSRTFDIEYVSTENNIKSIVFGYTLAGTYIKEIHHAQDYDGPPPPPSIVFLPGIMR